MKKPAKGMIMHHGKGGAQQMLPNRHAMNTLTKGDPSQRTMNNYAQATPGPAQASPGFSSPQAPQADPSQVAPGAYSCGGMI